MQLQSPNLSTFSVLVNKSTEQRNNYIINILIARIEDFKPPKRYYQNDTQIDTDTKNKHDEGYWCRDHCTGETTQKWGPFCMQRKDRRRLLHENGGPWRDKALPQRMNEVRCQSSKRRAQRRRSRAQSRSRQSCGWTRRAPPQLHSKWNCARHKESIRQKNVTAKRWQDPSPQYKEPRASPRSLKVNKSEPTPNTKNVVVRLPQKSSFKPFKALPSSKLSQNQNKRQNIWSQFQYISRIHWRQQKAQNYRNKTESYPKL